MPVTTKARTAADRVGDVLGDSRDLLLLNGRNGDPTLAGDEYHAYTSDVVFYVAPKVPVTTRTGLLELAEKIGKRLADGLDGIPEGKIRYSFRRDCGDILGVPTLVYEEQIGVRVTTEDFRIWDETALEENTMQKREVGLTGRLTDRKEKSITRTTRVVVYPNALPACELGGQGFPAEKVRALMPGFALDGAVDLERLMRRGDADSGAPV